MLTVGMDYDVRPERVQEFEALWAQVAERMCETHGHLRSRLFRDVQRPHSYMILSEWTDRDAFTAFTSSPTFRGVTELGAQDLLAGPPRHRVFI